MSNFFGKIKKWVKNFSKDVPVVGEVISFQDKAPYKERLKHLSGRAAAANKIPGAPDVIGLMKKSLDLSGVSLDNLSEVDARELYLACGGIADPRIDIELENKRSQLEYKRMELLSHSPNENSEEIKSLEDELEKLVPTPTVFTIASQVRDFRQNTLGFLG
ncbi:MULTISPECIES: hypothetical protein [unclassified Microcystis]|jgi:hypothetical protein|uniref:hypothetical protein n=1 Tax=Microcystis sp. TaxID=1127 RepID=UPI0022C7B9C9|nr:hypothetical protein [Microcystis sp. LE17-20D]MCZ8067635.1 hypothetical protein [Microcystis sp. LE17-20D]MCZ8159730.1 hypothetical protein [Microcystis sp. LE19-196.1B]MCZ8276614.1 hypothetical protein [Microcystis sp. LE19-4.1E]